MTVRSKLLLSYSLTLAALVAVGVTSVIGFNRWRTAVEEVQRIHTRENRSVKLRGELLALIAEGRAHLNKDSLAESRFQEIEKRAETELKFLLDSAESEIELDHVTGLQETHGELVWIFENIAGRGENIEVAGATERLEEISEEVVDDIAVLVRFYTQLRAEKIKSAEIAGKNTTYIIASAAGVVLVSIIALMILTGRWLTRPARAISKATERISAGDFSVRLPLVSHDEWSKLSEDINNMARALSEFEEKLAERERLAALGEVAAFAAHNIRNPLAGIRAAAQVALAEAKAHKDGDVETMQDIISSIDRLDVWVQRMMEFTKPLDIRLDRADVGVIVTDVCAISARSFGSKNITLRRDIPDDLPLVSADTSLLEQALSALLNNAYQATPVNGEIKVSVTREKIREGDVIRITVADSGSGVAPELRGKLFRLFASGKSDGSGLGLAQAKRIIEALGGKIGVEYPERGGAAFYIHLPERRQSDSSDVSSANTTA